MKNIVEKHGCFVLVVNWPQNRRRVQITTYNYNQQKNCGRFKKNLRKVRFRLFSKRTATIPNAHLGHNGPYSANYNANPLE